MLVQAWSLELRQVVIEIDCLEEIKILNRTSQALVGDSLVESIYNWTRKEWKLVFRHVPRDRNHFADKIAALGRTASRNGDVLLNPPATSTDLVEEDKDHSLVELVNAQEWLEAANMACFNLHDDPVG
ncbi:hypothetical protein V6N13_088773 [Hibiscus sabdariffa]|uniref:RNase H type-1 domain-containing protein n=1 Tax=Hibiscus sabdariffa TaxID=183260 RepID=A0ABR2G0E2_9ROSI